MIVNNKTTTISLTIISALVISACSSNSDNSPASDNLFTGTINQFGDVNVISRISNESGQLETQINANFYSTDVNVANDFAKLADVTTDACLLDTDDQENTITTTSISAGDSLVFTSDAGTYATISASQESPELSDGIDYEIDTPIAGAPPANLTLDIPGDTFPAFSSVTSPKVDAPEFFNYPVNAISNDTTFTWEPSTNPNTQLLLTFSTLPLNDMDRQIVQCTVADDGSFTIPSDFSTQIGGINQGAMIFALRTGVNWERSGESILAYRRIVLLDTK